jgi:hypothetical protein
MPGSQVTGIESVDLNGVVAGSTRRGFERFSVNLKSGLEKVDECVDVKRFKHSVRNKL